MCYFASQKWHSLALSIQIVAQTTLDHNSVIFPFNALVLLHLKLGDEIISSWQICHLDMKHPLSSFSLKALLTC